MHDGVIRMRIRWYERVSWCLFDFANSAFVTIMITAFYGRYFTDVIARHSRAPSTLWGSAIALAMALVALSSPVLGAIADRTGNKRTMLRLYTVVNVLACAALGLVRPGTSFAVTAALVLIVIADVAFEGAYVFYNAFLSELAPPDKIGRLSGYGWAVGYAGGLGCLILVNLAGWVPEHYGDGASGHPQIVPVAVAAWFAVFSLPMLTLVRERIRPAKPPSTGYASQAWRDLRESFRFVRANKNLFRFFLAYLLYTDAVETVIAFTSKFTGDALHFSPADTVRLFLVLNIVAVPGALIFGYLVDRIGGVRGVALSLVLWLVVTGGSTIVQTKAQFWPIAILAAIGLGATQSASRAIIARWVPQTHLGRVFGMMTVVGRASAVVGPILYGVVDDITGNPRLAIGAVSVVLAAGLVVLLTVKEQSGCPSADAPVSS